MNTDPLEKDIESHGTSCARERGILHLKFVSPAHQAVPDRIVLAPIPEFLRELVEQYVRFIEYKRKGKKPTPAQDREHARLRALGFRVDVIDNKADAEALMGKMG